MPPEPLGRITFEALAAASLRSSVPVIARPPAAAAIWRNFRRESIAEKYGVRVTGSRPKRRENRRPWCSAVVLGGADSSCSRCCHDRGRRHRVRHASVTVPACALSALDGPITTDDSSCCCLVYDSAIKIVADNVAPYGSLTLDPSVDHQSRSRDGARGIRLSRNALAASTGANSKEPDVLASLATRPADRTPPADPPALCELVRIYLEPPFSEGGRPRSRRR